MIFDLSLIGVQACLLASLYPYLFYLRNNKLRLCITVILIIISFLIASRALFIVVLAVFFYQYNSFRIILKSAYTYLTIILSFALLMAINVDSIAGRLFIWKNILMNFSKVPILGFGSDTFKVEYSKWQMSYFSIQDKYSYYHGLADSPSFAFNEMLHYFVEYGLLSFILFLLILIFNIKILTSRKDSFLQSCLLSNITILTFSLFSYSLHSIWVLLILLLNHLIVLLIKIKVNKLIISSLVFSIIVWFCLMEANQIEAKANWKYVQSMPINESVEKELLYNQLTKKLNKNQYFVNEYFTFLLNEKKYQPFFESIYSSKKYFNQYEYNLLLGDVHLQNFNYDSANIYFTKAHLIIPNRFIPLYNLMTISSISNDRVLANYYATKIIYTPIKINNPISLQIKQQAKAYIQNK